MKLSDFNLLKKCLVMTDSPNDGEALAALRQAQRIMKKAGDVTWERLFARLVSIDVEEADVAPSDPADDGITDAIFQKALDNSRGDFRNVVQSIYEQYQERGRISDKQRAVIVRAAANEGRR